MFKKIVLVLKKFLLLGAALIFLLFIFTNAEYVEINLLPFGFRVKIRAFLLVTLSFLGGILTEYFCSLLNFRKIREKFLSRKKIKNLENELEKIKNGGK
ncbi:MAG: hypothetical protein LBB09_03655 [Rickettsiales bacterium]|jgi:uncharacterized integral membrane protein|nr:hypothetical protein [Rickettsiales bacterium]